MVCSKQGPGWSRTIVLGNDQLTRKAPGFFPYLWVETEKTR
jgi:hypothetical protein